MTLEDIINCHKDNKGYWDEIRKAYANDKLIPFVGAGMSRPAYPTWSDALKMVLEGSAEEIKELEGLFEKFEYEEAAEFVYKTIGNNIFYARIQKVFSKNRINECGLSEAIKVLPDLFGGLVFTTNFDKCLEEAYGQKGKKFENEWLLPNMNQNRATTLDSIRNNPHNLYKIHGDIDDCNSLVFLKKEYDDAYGNKEFVEALKKLTEVKTFLFLGCSLEGNDRYVKLIGESIRSCGAAVIKNYTFLPLPTRSEDMTDTAYDKFVNSRIRQLGKMGIFPLWFPSGQYEAVEILLKSLSTNGMLSENKKIPGDETNEKKHFNVFRSEIKIDQIFVDKKNDYYEYDSGLYVQSEKKIQFNSILSILENNRVLFVEGEYGTGKTTLMKHLQEELIKQQYETRFYEVTSLCGDKVKSLAEQVPDNKVFFVFIDTINKLIDSEDEKSNMRRIDTFYGQIIDFMKKHEFCHVIVSSRPYLPHYKDNKINKMSEIFALKVIEELELNIVPCVGTKTFLTEECDTFWEKMKNPSFEQKLTHATIKQWNKKAPNTCKIPLFAYVIGDFFYRKLAELEREGRRPKAIDVLPENPIEVYEDFVSRTISGHFKPENISIGDDIKEALQSILRTLAVNLICTRKEEIDYKDTCNEMFSTENLFAIKIKSFGEQIEKMVDDTVSHVRLSTSYVLNNYFFSIYKNADKEWVVSFSDVNVLSYFAASKHYDTISTLKETFDEKMLEKKSENLKIELSMYELHPQTIDFLLCRLMQLSIESRDVMLYNIECILKRYKNNPVADVSEVKFVLLMFIVYIKLKKDSYNDFKDFFKVFYRLCKTAKALNICGEHKQNEHRYLIERYFMQCNFIQCVFKRLNYKYYNFSYSELDDSSFTQCNFYKNEFDGCKIKDVDFTLCMFNNISGLKNTRFCSGIRFDNCKFQKTDLLSPNLQECKTIVFDCCSIKDLSIKSACNTETIFVFKNCILDNIQIEDSKMTIKINSCVILGSGKLKVKKSSIYSDEPNMFEKKPGFSLQPIPPLRKKEVDEA